jgi:hypothetical protein
MSEEIAELFEGVEPQDLPGVRITEIGPNGLYRIEFEPLTPVVEEDGEIMAGSLTGALYRHRYEVSLVAVKRHLFRLQRIVRGEELVYGPIEVTRDIGLYLALRNTIIECERVEGE